MIDEYSNLYTDIITVSNHISSAHEQNTYQPIAFLDALIATSLNRSIVLCKEISDIEDRLSESLGYTYCPTSAMPTLSYIRDLTHSRDIICHRLNSHLDTSLCANYYYSYLDRFRSDCNILHSDKTIETNSLIQLYTETTVNESKFPKDIDTTFSILYALESSGVLVYRICKTLEIVEAQRAILIPLSPDIVLLNTWVQSTWKNIDHIAMSSVVAYYDLYGLTVFTKTKAWILCCIIRDQILEKSRHPPCSDFYDQVPISLYIISRMTLSADTMCLFNRAYTYEYNKFLINTDTVRHPTDINLLLTSRTHPEHRPEDNCCAESDKCLRPISRSLEDIASKNQDTHTDYLGALNSHFLFVHDKTNQRTTYAQSSLFDAVVSIEARLCDYAKYIKSKKYYTDPPHSYPQLLYTNSHIDENHIYITLHLLIEKIVRITSPYFHIEETEESARSQLSSIIDSHDVKIYIHMYRISRVPIDLFYIHLFGVYVYHRYNSLLDLKSISKQNVLIHVSLYAIWYQDLHTITSKFPELTRYITEIIQGMNFSLFVTETNYFNQSTKSDEEFLLSHGMKSIGICIAPIIHIYQTLTPRDTSKLDGVVHAIKNFFLYFNLARQIADDAKDTTNDYVQGKTNTTFSILKTQASIEYQIFYAISRSFDSLKQLELYICTYSYSTETYKLISSLRHELICFGNKACVSKWHNDMLVSHTISVLKQDKNLAMTT